MQNSERHPLDKALGEIHEIAIMLKLFGLGDTALRLATAHENIQTYLIENDPALAD